MSNFFQDLFVPGKALAKGVGLGGLYESTDPNIMTKEIIDPAKQAVSNPLSSFLTGNIGQGIPRYGKPILTDLPQGGGASVNPFLSQTVDSLYSGIRDSAVGQFKNTYSDLLEQSAGGLSSSRRAYNDNTAVTNLSLGLADKRAALELGLPQAQLGVATSLKDSADKEANAQYQDWMKSLPEYNPILDKAINYLSNNTSTGSTILSALDPGRESDIMGLFKAVAPIIGKVAAGA